MAIVPNFSTAQPLGYPSQIIFVDTSTGSDSNIVQRRIYLRQSDGTFPVPSGTSTQYILWAYADASITVDVLDKDRGLEVTVEWNDMGGTAIYNKIQPIGFTAFNEEFDYNLTQQLSGNPLNIDDDSFWQLKGDLRTAIDSGDKAILDASDIVGAQQCYDKATNLRVNSQYFFNKNA